MLGSYRLCCQRQAIQPGRWRGHDAFYILCCRVNIFIRNFHYYLVMHMHHNPIARIFEPEKYLTQHIPGSGRGQVLCQLPAKERDASALYHGRYSLGSTRKMPIMQFSAGGQR